MLSFSFIVSLEKNHFFFMGSDPESVYLFSFSHLAALSALPAAHHGEVCDLSKRFLICPSSIGSYRSFVLFINSLEMFIFSLWGLTPRVFRAHSYYSECPDPSIFFLLIIEPAHCQCHQTSTY